MSSRTRVLVTAAMMALALGAGAQAAAAWDVPAPWPGAMAGKPVPGYDSAPGGPRGYQVVESGTVTDWTTTSPGAGAETIAPSSQNTSARGPALPTALALPSARCG